MDIQTISAKIGVLSRVFEFGTLVSLLRIRIRPQNLVVLLVAMGPEIDPHGKAKSQLDKYSRLDRIQLVLPALKKEP